MKASILFLIVFAGSVIFGDVVIEWPSWFFGVVTGMAIVKLMFSFTEGIDHEQKRTTAPRRNAKRLAKT